MSSLPVVLRAAQHYAELEARRMASFGQLPQVVPDFSGLKNIALRDGLAHLLIDPRHQPRIFDVPMAYFLKIAEALGGNLLLNSRERRGKEARAYVRLDFGQVGTYVNRVITDAPIGRVVREAGTNFRSHLPEHLHVEEAPLRDGPGKHINGRWDAIEAILTAYDRAGSEAHVTITHQGLEDLLSGLLVLADARASERRMAKAKGVAA